MSRKILQLDKLIASRDALALIRDIAVLFKESRSRLVTARVRELAQAGLDGDLDAVRKAQAALKTAVATNPRLREDLTHG